MPFALTITRSCCKHLLGGASGVPGSSPGSPRPGFPFCQVSVFVESSLRAPYFQDVSGNSASARGGGAYTTAVIFACRHQRAAAPRKKALAAAPARSRRAFKMRCGSGSQAAFSTLECFPLVHAVALQAFLFCSRLRSVLLRRCQSEDS